MMQIRNFGARLLLLSMATFLMAFPEAWSAPVQSATQSAQTVQTLETTLFAIQYDQDTMENRVIRLEETVFGQRQSGPLDSRVLKLKTALSPSTLGPLSAQPAKPVSQTATVDNTAKSRKMAKPLASSPSKGNQSKSTANSYGGSYPTASAPPSAAPSSSNAVATPIAGESDYPTISQMEDKLFGRLYLREDVTARLSRLEKEVFKVPQTGALSDRMDNLQLVVLGDTGVSSPPSRVIPYIGGSNGYINPPGQPAVYTPPAYGQQPGNGYYAPPVAYGPNSGYYPGSQVASAGPVYGNSNPAYPQVPGNYQPMPGNYQPPPYGVPGDQQASYQPGGLNPGMANGQVSPDLLAAMDEVEKQVLGHTFPSEPVTGRLDRLEAKVFHVTSPEMPPNDRMQRVIAVASAGGAPSSPQAKAKSTFQNLLPIILTILPLILL